MNGAVEAFVTIAAFMGAVAALVGGVAILIKILEWMGE